MNAPKLKNFIFRNYNLPPEVFSHYPGNCKQRVWEAIRASSAAPGYYEECKLGDFIHQVSHAMFLIVHLEDLYRSAAM